MALHVDRVTMLHYGQVGVIQAITTAMGLQ